MSWQLWVLIAAAAIAAAWLVIARFRKAQQVLDDLIDSVEPHQSQRATTTHRPEVAPTRVDDLARQRSRHHLRTTFVPRTAHSHRTRH
ncbi:hypothetical protein [Kribbella sp. NPDC051770]|uniref:hypothetical protein n=1 Tax=Kribbella sp. NPDC051770 TaxID=3155413 RepID=UPI00342AD591